ncbi:hypothetical protein MLD52_17710 [Puniceicoccaceae bacterium K14]|nr:hypothetical protein [Puniceicoccaceae bacterium K14]
MTDEQLQIQFESQTLPFDLWDHRMHVRIAYIYSKSLHYTDALNRLREGIKTYNTKNNVTESQTTGYNETMTVAFLRLIKNTVDSYEGIYPTTNSESFCNKHPHLLAKTILRTFYSPERRSLPEAKTQFVEPDLSSLPEPKQLRHLPERDTSQQADSNPHTR